MYCIVRDLFTYLFIYSCIVVVESLKSGKVREILLISQKQAKLRKVKVTAQRNYCVSRRAKFCTTFPKLDNLFA